MTPETEDLVPLPQLADVVRRWAAQVPEISRVYLFGSRVSGASRRGGPPVPGVSDLDIAVVFTHDPERQRTEHWMGASEEWQGTLEALLPVRPEVWDAAEPRVAGYLRACSLVIFVRATKSAPVVPQPDQ